MDGHSIIRADWAWHGSGVSSQVIEQTSHALPSKGCGGLNTGGPEYVAELQLKVECGGWMLWEACYPELRPSLPRSFFSYLIPTPSPISYSHCGIGFVYPQLHLLICIISTSPYHLTTTS